MNFFQAIDKETNLVKSEVGSKAYNLSILKKLNINTPEGFVIKQEACNYFLKQLELPEDFKGQLLANVLELEKKTNKKFGGLENPLLVSVRSGSIVSMPGMMDTILNLGLNNEIVESLAKKTLRPRFAYDCYKRFICMYGEIVLKIDKKHFEKQIKDYLIKRKFNHYSDLNETELKILCELLKLEVKKHSNLEFPENPLDQLLNACTAVFNSWNNQRAISYRKYYGIDHRIGTACLVQEMVFGNLGNSSATGVIFTRNPNTGENTLFGEYLKNAQGEDVVDGSHNGKKIEELKNENSSLYNEIEEVSKKLESHFTDLQDIEFTIEDGKLYILQTRDGKRTGQAAVKIAIDLLNSGIIDKKTAINRVKGKDFHDILHPVLAKNSKVEQIGKGLGASFGATKGFIALSSEKALELSKSGSVILVRGETSPEDIDGMHCSKGILTHSGGITSHAAVIARSIGKVCVCAANFEIDEINKELIFESGFKLKEGASITIDGSSGKIYIGDAKFENNSEQAEMDEFLDLIDENTENKVLANCDNLGELKTALAFGAKGVGLCRLEHLVKSPAIITEFQSYLIKPNQSSLTKIKNFIKNEIFAMNSLLDKKVFTIRILDAPLHEFLPQTLESFEKIASVLNMDENQVIKLVQSMKENNPMLGYRASRYAIIEKNFYKITLEAIFEAALASNLNEIYPKTKIMLPLVFDLNEIVELKKYFIELKHQYKNEITTEIEFGLMLETPRACILAHEMALEVDFLSFGTNDLTQLIYGISRDDSSKFLDSYNRKGIINANPFEKIDVKAVAKMMKTATDNARAVNPKLSIGVCGEQAADDFSGDIFLQELELDYLSVSGYNVLPALLSEARNNLK